MFGWKLDKGRKFLLIAGLLALLAGGLYRFWPLIQGLGGSNEDILLKRKQILKYQTVLQDRNELERQAKSLDTILKNRESTLFTGETSAIAASDIQKVLRRIAQESQVEIKTVRVLKPDEAENPNYLSIPVQLNIDGTIRNLKEFFSKIVASPKCLTVRKVGLRVFERRKRSTQTIRADVTVHGYLKKGQN